MKRELRLIRKILEYVESRTSGGMAPAPECPQYSWEKVHYHIGLCGQADYLEIRKISGAEDGQPRYDVGNMTWQGHEALDRLRSQPLANTYQ